MPRKLSPFVVFCNKNRARVKELNPTAQFADMGRLLAEIWSNLSEQTKNIYRVEAERLHNIAVEEWKEKNPPKPVENVDTRWKAYVMPSGQIRKPSPFVLFANKNRAQVQEMNPGAGFAEIGRKMGEIWHAIDGKTRAIFEKEALKLKEQATKESKKAKRLAKKKWAEANEVGILPDHFYWEDPQAVPICAFCE